MKYGRRPPYFWKLKTTSFFSNGRQPQFWSRHPRKLIFGMPPYFDPTRWNMEDDLNNFENGRRSHFFSSHGGLPQFCSRQPTELIFGMQSYSYPTRRNMEDDLNNFCKGRRPQKELCNQRQLKTKIFLKMEDDLNFFENGRRPQFIWKWKTTLKN